MDKSALLRELDRCVFALMRDKKTRFMSIVATNLTHSIGDTLSCRDENNNPVIISVSTAITDYKRCLYNPDFFTSLNIKEKLFLVCHEVGHVFLKHDMRCGKRNRAIWGKAADYELNAMLRGMGLIMPACGLYSSRFEGISAEEIYNILVEENPDWLTNPPKNDDVHFVASNQSPVEKQLLEAQVDLLINQSVEMALASGISLEELPATLQGIITRVRKPKLNPIKAYGNLLSASFGFSKFNYSKPHKKSTDVMYRPSRQGTSVKTAYFYMDASGSVDDHLFSVYVAAVEVSIRRLKPKNIKIILFDSGIRSEISIKRPSDVYKIDLIGRGGTNIGPVIEHIHKHKPDLAVVFTDGDYYIPDHCKVTTPTFWFINDYYPDFRMPHTLGKTVHYSST